MDRRGFLKVAAMAGTAALIPWRLAYAAFAQTLPLRKFIQPLRGLGGATGIPLATPNRSVYPGLDYYQIALREFTDQLHPDLPPTRLWGYGDATPGAPFRHLGGVIAANRGVPVRINVVNELPDAHILPVDQSIPGAEPGQPQNRAAIHLHGGFVPWASDGGPFHWSTPEGLRGPSVIDWLPTNNPLAPTNNDHYYPNDQSARLMWYHDHAIGITRLNAYAGLASGYVLRDPAELALIAAGAIPWREIPLIIQDKIFGPDGSLWYPSVYDQELFAYLPPSGAPPLPVPSTGPEFWGDTMLVNGTAYPYAEVESRRYRLRILNACNTRFVTLRLVYARGPGFPNDAEPNPHRPGPAFQQIGTEGGFLPAPVTASDRRGLLLTLAPAERADVIVDFGETEPGDTLILYNDAPVPFPNGTPLADFFPRNNRLVSPPAPGFGPNTRTLMQFRVIPRTGARDDKPVKLRLPDPDPPLLVPAGVMTPPPGAVVRDLTLNEAIDQFGRLSQLLGTNTPTAPGAFGRPYMDTPTETPVVDAVEVWRIFNLTEDAHPIHFHLVNVQILSRQAFEKDEYTGSPAFEGSPVPPDPNEVGWKETVRMNPGECTTVVMQFKLPVVRDWRDPGSTIDVPPSPRTGGHEYVWHCHILEHEEHDMMRPLIVG